MNHDAILELLDRIDGNSRLMRRFLNDPSIEDHMAALEVLGRCNIIEAKVAQIRAEMAHELVDHHRPDSNVHVIGNRGDDAA